MHNGRRIIDIVRENKDDNKKLMHGLEHIDFFSDFSGHIFLKELDEQYAGSKFILTIRDLKSWLKSRERHVKRNQRNPEYKYNFIKVDKAAWRMERENVLAKLNEYFKDRPDDFLIINICGGDGWEKLCGFLKVPVPDQPFPQENITRNKYLFQTFLNKIKKNFFNLLYHLSFIYSLIQNFKV